MTRSQINAEIDALLATYGMESNLPKEVYHRLLELESMIKIINRAPQGA